MRLRRALLWGCLFAIVGCGGSESGPAADAGALADGRAIDAALADAALADAELDAAPPEPDAMEPDAMEPDAMEPDAMEPDAMEPEPDAMEPDAAPPEPDAMEPDAAPPEPDAMEPDAMEPDAGPPPPTTYRVGLVDHFDSLDPSNEYTSIGWGVLRNLLVRNLVGYRHVAGAPGVELVPDLATEIPEPTDGDLTYTFTLRPGVRFGPPLDRPITSHDLLFAMRRLLYAPIEPAYGGYYYDLIAGMDLGPGDELPDVIAGIETPDDQTIVFHLTRPSADFLHLLAMPAAGAVPEEVAGCFDEPGAYGGVLVSSGPYMIEGSELLDTTSCETLEPHPGWDMESGTLDLSRNPAYDPASDEPDHRPSLVDRFHFMNLEDPTESYPLLESGALEELVTFVDPEVVDRYQADPELADRLRIESIGALFYIAMKLTQPPFDDVHVRRAVLYLFDRAASAGALGEDLGEAATHIFPPELTGGHPTADEYAPYGTGGDLVAARAEMALSAYDTNGDGRCDGSDCRPRAIARDVPGLRAIGEALDTALVDIGIRLDTEFLDTPAFYGTLLDPTNDVAIASGGGWASDYPDIGGFAPALFHSRFISEFNFNFTMLGLTAARAQELGIPGNVVDVPSVDAELDACSATLDDASRFACWRELDVTLSEQVAPIVPVFWRKAILILGAAVTAHDFDQASGSTAFSRVDVDPALQQ